MKKETIDEGILNGAGIPPLNDDGDNQNDASTNTYGTIKIKGKAKNYKRFKLSAGRKLNMRRNGRQTISHNASSAKSDSSAVIKATSGIAVSKWKR